MCGAVEFTVAGVSNDFGTCYCDACRKWASLGFMSTAADLNNMNIRNADSIQVIDSSAWADRSFCGSCGSPLWYRMKGEDGKATAIYLSVGLLDDISDMSLTLELYIDKKPKSLGPAVAPKTMTEAEILAAYAPGNAET